MPDNWSPLDLGASLLGWWDAAHGVTESSGVVSAWDDKVGPYSATEATNRPDYSATSFNGGPGITFTAANSDVLTVASQPFPSGSTPSEIWVVADLLGTASSLQSIFGFGGTTNGTTRRVQRGAGNNVSFGADNNGTNVAVSNSTQDWGGRRVLRHHVTATELRYAIDGGALSSASTVAPTTGTTHVRIGASQAASPTTFCNMIVRDIIITAILSADQEARMNRFTLWRRGG
jgi:hypothetical protein